MQIVIIVIWMASALSGHDNRIHLESGHYQKSA